MESIQKFIQRKNSQFQKEKTDIEKKLIRMKDIGREGRFYLEREDWVFLPQSNLNKKVFILERLKKIEYDGKLAYAGWKKGDIEYRIGYYIVGRIGRTKGKWIWGQFCPLIPHDDLKKLIDLAKKKKVIL